MKTDKIATVSQRRILPARPKPYYTQLNKGFYLGFRKAPDTRAETWSVRVRINGGYKSQSLGMVSTERDYTWALQAAEQYLYELNSNRTPTRVVNARTVGDVLREYIDVHKTRRPAATWERDAMRRARACVWNRPISRVVLVNLKAQHLEDLQYELRATMTGESVNRNLTGLRAALNWGHRRGYTQTTPWKHVPLMKEAAKEDKKRNKAYFTQAEREEFIAAAKPELAAICRAMMLTGARPCEIRKVQAKDVNLATGAILLRSLKGDNNETYSTRAFHLAGPSLQFFARQLTGLSGEDHLFLSPRGAPWAMDNLSKAIRACREDNGLSDKWESYCFRHAAITDWINAGIPAMNVGKACGTSTRYIEKNYHTTSDDLAGQLAGVFA